MITAIRYNSHEEWLELRKNGIGGSDASAVVGLNPYKSAYQLWAEKTGKMSAFDGNLITKVGAYLEEFVANLFEEETGKKVRKNNSIITNSDYPFAFANIDRKVVAEDALLEIKTTNSLPIMKQLRTQEFPEAYYCQCVHYLAVTGLKKCYLAVLINCRDFKVFELERDENEINALMEAEKNFWNCVTEDKAPAIDGSTSSSNTLSELYPESNEDSIDLFGFESELIEYDEISKQIKELTALKDEKANKIKEFMKEASKGESSRYKVSYATSDRRTFDVKRFAQENKNINIDGYYNVTSSRIFKVTTKGDK